MSIGNEVKQLKTIKDAEYKFCYNTRYGYDLQFWNNFISALNDYSSPWNDQPGSSGAKLYSNIETIEEDKPPHMLLTGQEGCSVVNVLSPEKRPPEQNAQQVQSKLETHRSLLIQLQRSRISDQIQSQAKQNLTPCANKTKNQKHPVQDSKPVNPEKPKEKPSYASVSSLRIGNSSLSNTVKVVGPTAVKSTVNTATVINVRPTIVSLPNMRFASVTATNTRPKNTVAVKTVTTNTGARPKTVIATKKPNSGAEKPKKPNVSLPNSPVTVTNSSTRSASASRASDSLALENLPVNIPRPGPGNFLESHIQQLISNPDELEIYNVNLLIYKYN